MQTLAKAHDWLINALKVVSGVIVIAIFVLIVLDVLLPLAKIQPWEGTLGVVEYGLLWFTVLAAPWLARIKGHVFIDAVAELLPPVVKKVTSKISYVVAIVGSLMLAYYSALLLIEAYMEENVDERSIELMLWWIPLANIVSTRESRRANRFNGVFQQPLLSVDILLEDIRCFHHRGRNNVFGQATDCRRLDAACAAGSKSAKTRSTADDRPRAD